MHWLELGVWSGVGRVGGAAPLTVPLAMLLGGVRGGRAVAGGRQGGSLGSVQQRHAVVLLLRRHAALPVRHQLHLRAPRPEIVRHALHVPVEGVGGRPGGDSAPRGRQGLRGRRQQTLH